MKAQMSKLGTLFDWDCELSTCDPEYYKFTQWIFLKLYQRGLAYKSSARVNWDPVDMTVLANEQVDEKGFSWRSGAKVIKKTIPQWFFKITAFGKALQMDLSLLKEWPDAVKEMQKGWIGMSSGAIVKFGIRKKQSESNEGFLEVYTTRVDTLFGVTFIAVAPDHQILTKGQLLDSSDCPEVKEILNEIADQSDTERKIAAGKKDEKKGFLIEHSECVHPLTNQPIPIYVSNYVLSGYGTGIIMGVPAHDERDKDFANSYGISEIQVVGDENILCNSQNFSGLKTIEGAREILKTLKESGKGKTKTNFALRVLSFLISS
jgi:leucyl-tRNA synthetase